MNRQRASEVEIWRRSLAAFSISLPAGVHGPLFLWTWKQRFVGLGGAQKCKKCDPWAGRQHTANYRLPDPNDRSMLSLVPTWNLTCQNCSKSFAHSKVEEGNLANYFLPQKPEFPAEGQELQCPNCNTKAQYQQADLRYDSK